MNNVKLVKVQYIAIEHQVSKTNTQVIMIEGSHKTSKPSAKELTEYESELEKYKGER